MRDSEVLDNGVRRAYSADSVISMERELCEFDGKWLEAVGKPELKGT